MGLQTQACVNPEPPRSLKLPWHASCKSFQHKILTQQQHFGVLVCVTGTFRVMPVPAAVSTVLRHGWVSLTLPTATDSGTHSRSCFLTGFVASFFSLPFAVGSARYGSPKRQLQFYR